MYALVFYCTVLTLSTVVHARDLCQMCTCTTIPSQDCCDKNVRQRRLSVVCNNDDQQPVCNPFPLNVPSDVVVLVLAIHKYNIPHLRRDDLANLNELRSLNLSRNDIADVDVLAFANLTSLTTLDLSHNNITNVTFLNLNFTLKSINLSYNSIKLLNSSSFRNCCADDVAIELFNSRITTIESGTFSGLEMRSLNLSCNVINTSLPSALYGIRRVDELVLRYVKLLLPEMTSDYWQNVTENITTLDLSHNNIKKIGIACFAKFSNLRTLQMNKSRIKTIKSDSFKGLQQLETLKLTHNDWLLVFPMFSKGQECFTPNLTVLDLRWSGITRIDNAEYFYCLAKLEELLLANTGVFKLSKKMFKFATNLQTLDLNQCRLKTIEKQAFFGTKLKKLDIGNNMVNFNKDLCFWHIPLLEELILDRNNFSDYPVKNNYFEGRTPQLKRLSMNSLTQFKNFSENTFSGLTNLTHLYLNHLNLNWVDWHLFKNTSLTNLYMRKNGIRKIDMTSIPENIYKNLRVFDLDGNAFICNCALLPFIKWVCEDNKTEFPNGNNYMCLSGGQRMRLCDFQETRCDVNSRVMVMIFLGTVAVIMLTLVPLAVALSWRHRYSIKYFALKCRAAYSTRTSERQGYLFVNSPGQLVWYTDADVTFVKDKVVPLVEDELKVTLICKDRDFLGGGSYGQHIVDSIEQSRQIILICSNSLTSNGWIKFVVDLLQNKILMEQCEYPICILREEIEEENLFESLSWLISNSPTVKWPEHESDDAMKALRIELGELLDNDLNNPACSLSESLTRQRHFGSINNLANDGNR